MEDTQRIVKCGNLSLHTPGGFFKKRWHSKYLVLYDGSKSGVKRLELFDSEIKFKKQNPVKIIPLVDCVRVVTCQRHKTTFTFEVRTSDQFYLLASKSFQDMNDWVNCLRLVAFGQQLQSADTTTISSPLQRPPQQTDSSNGCINSQSIGAASTALSSNKRVNCNDPSQKTVDVLLSRQQPPSVSSSGELNNGHQVSALANNGLVSATSRLQATTANGTHAPNGQELRPQILTASQAASAAASALAKTRQRQPSLLGTCKPQPPNDSPFLKSTDSKMVSTSDSAFNAIEQMNTLTPTVRGQLIAAAGSSSMVSNGTPVQPPATKVNRSQVSSLNGRPLQIGASLDEEEENMLYCSIEDNPSEHNYRVKVIETELALRCQLKCYQLTASTTISRQYEELAQFRLSSSSSASSLANSTTLPRSSSPTTTAANLDQAGGKLQPAHLVTFYQLIIGPQELTLLNDYATCSSLKAINNKLHPNQQGLWSWPYQCIRRYGFDKDNCFMFEAGRKCTSGPGQFIVQTPKAYSIYQDVVKFVNELRTISATSGQQKPIAMTQAQTNDSMQQRQAKQMIVTQIPVTWTPTSNSNGINNNNTCSSDQSTQSNPNDVVSSRRQFFDGLRQLDQQNGSVNGRGQLVNGTKEANDNLQENLANWHGVEPMSKRAIRNDAALPNANSTGGNYSNEQQQPKKPSMSTIRGDAQEPNAKLNSHDEVSNGSIGQLKPPVTSSIRVEGDQQRQQLASIPSCASDETDESGYEQGDESVDSAGSMLKKSPQQQHNANARQTLNNWRNNPSGMRTTATSRLAVSSEHSSTMSSAASSCSPSSSASNSPGQSISRRTADLMASQHTNGSNQMNGGHQLSGPLTSQNSARPRLPLPNSLTQQAASEKELMLNAKSNETTLSQRSNSSNLHNLLTANLLTDPNGPNGDGRATTRTAEHSGKMVKSQLRPDEDFETSLIRDVYSEISKLHAKFAVTTNGADDSMSSGGESAVISSSSTENNSEAPINRRGAHGGDDENSQDEEDYDSMERDDIERTRSVIGVEPMYSNLKPAGELNGVRRIDTTNNDDHLHQADHSRQPNNMNRLHFHEHVRPPPLYPTMLNPIPEIAENHLNLAPSKVLQRDRHESLRNVNNNNKALSHNNDCLFAADRDVSLEGLPRARLALNRDVIKKSQQSVGQHSPSPRQQLSSAAMGNSKRPTNHYLINDVQYAKISRNLGSAGRISNQDHTTSAQRLR